MELKNRVCVITGATGGLGSVVTRQFAANGARLALISTNTQKLQTLSKALNLPAQSAWFGAYDLRRAESARQAAQDVLHRFGKVDILIHTVGGWVGGKPLVETPEHDMAAMLDQHLWSAFHTAQGFIPLMTANGWGRFVVISAPSAVQPSAKGAPYAAGKAALEAMTLSLAQDLKGSGVTANIIQVSFIDTEHKRDQAPTPANAGWSTPEEITAAILYLCSPEGGRLNGARLPLFG
ncbi:MAG: SDR family oxidoreductase [Anaerolineae bacterium]|nr:SDR family oxidoreductase [Anaerolineae bacterium]